MSKFLDENGLSYFWSKIKASLKTVAFTGSYNDLTNKPNIPQGATVDTELNSSSTNPVQNKAIHSALATKVTSAQAIQAVSGAGYATSANASAIASSLISAGGYVTSTYVAGATVTSAGTATNAASLGGVAAGNFVRTDNVNQTVSGTKTFVNTISANGFRATTSYGLHRDVNDDRLILYGAQNSLNGAFITLNGKEHSTSGTFAIGAVGSSSYTLTGKHDGTLTWDGLSMSSPVFSGAKVALSNGTNIPAENSANHTKYLRGDGVWSDVNATSLGGSAASVYEKVGHTHSYLPLSGGTVTGNVTISGLLTVPNYRDSATAFCRVNTSNTVSGGTDRVIRMNTQTNGNMGIYDINYNKWMLRADATGNVYMNGTANNATTWGGYTNDISTDNTSDTWLLVASNTAIQHRRMSTLSVGTAASCTGNAANVTGTVAIEHGGTGQTTRLNAIKALTNENVSTNATHFLGLKSDWSKVGYVSVADAKTVLGLGTAAYTASTAYAAASHTHSYLPLTGGTLTGSLTISRGNPYLYFVETDWSKGTPQTSGTSYQGIYFSGSNAEGGHITFHYQQDKASYLQLVCQNLTSAGANANTSIFVATAADGTKHVRPGANNDTDLGLSGYKWKNVYATTFSGALAGNATTATNASSLGGKAASQYLTAHQSLANYVTLNGTQTITGTKSFSDAIYLTPNWHNSVCLKAQSYTYTASSPATPSTSIWNGVWLQDKSGNTIGYVQVQFSSSGNTFCELNANSPKSGGHNLYIRLYHNNAGTLKTFRPETTNLITLGHGDNRWKQYFGSSSDSISSDERIKQQITSIPDEILDAWEDIQWYQYKMNDSVAEKGTEKARFHTGLITQRIQTIFQQHNLDASKYGFWCYDSWEAEPAEYNDKGEIITKAKKAGDEYSLRYEEALCLEAAYQRRRADRAEARITALEQRLNELEEVLGTLGDHSNAS